MKAEGSPEQASALRRLREANKLQLVSLIREYGPISKDQLRRWAQLSLSAVNKSLQALKHEEKVLLCDYKPGDRGPAAARYSLNPEVEYLIGVDLGATNLKIALVGYDLKVAKLRVEKMWKKRVPNYMISRAVQMISEVLKEQQVEMQRVRGIGVGWPGAIDEENGVGVRAPNLGDAFDKLPVVAMISKALGRSAALANVPITLVHDSTCMVLAEKERGGPEKQRRREKNFACLSLGTGVGVGLYLNDQVYTGCGDLAGEIGHSVVQDDGPQCEGCGHYGCLETVASSKALKAKAIVAVRCGIKTKMRSYLSPTGELEVEDIAAAANEGDDLALRLFRDLGTHLGRAAANLVNLLSLEALILGGGLAENFGHFKASFMESYQRTCWPYSRFAKELTPQVTCLKEEAVPLGAAIRVFENLYGVRHIPDNRIQHRAS